MTPPALLVVDFLAALAANCFRGALPPVDLRAVCLVRAIGPYFDERNVCEWGGDRMIGREEPRIGRATEVEREARGAGLQRKM